MTQMKIEKILHKEYNIPTIILIFKDEELLITYLHAFMVIRDNETIALNSQSLRVGDLIWIDTSAFRADESLRAKTKRY